MLGLDHYCQAVDDFPINKFLQVGEGTGQRVLIVGEAPATNGWRKSGRAFYTPDGKLLPTGKNLNKLLGPFGLSVETCSFTELVKCYPGKDRKLLSQCGIKCWPIFLKQVNSLRARVIILLGIKTLEILNSMTGANLKVGELVWITLGDTQYRILPIYHPSPIAPFNQAKNVQIFEKVSKSLSISAL